MSDYLYRIVPFYRNWGGHTIGLHSLDEYELMVSLWKRNARHHRALTHTTMLEF